jgi:hypothetical protein
MSDPSSTDGSAAPHTVTARIASAPSSRSAEMFAWWVTEDDSSAWPSRWRETWRTSTPANVPEVTGTRPNRVWTSPERASSKSGRAYVPEPVMIPMRIARSYEPGPARARPRRRAHATARCSSAVM